jgi:predicted transcriptional regulator
MDTNTLGRVHLNAFVDVDIRRELERLAREADRSLSAEIRRALAAHVERETTDEGDAP